MPINKINKALKDNFKELDRAYLNTLGSAEQKLLAMYKTALNDLGAQIKSVYDKWGDNPTITELRKFNRLVTIETQMAQRVAELTREVTNTIQSTIKTTLISSFETTVNGINQGMGFNFVDGMLNQEGMNRYLSDNLWTDSMKNNGADLWSKTKRDFETVLRANSKEEVLSGVAQGKSYTAIMKDIEERFNVSATRAKTITFTEVHKAHSYSRNEGIKTAQDAASELGLQAGKVWRHNGVGKPREDHVDADGQFANKDGMFNVGGEELEAPGLGSDPANNINCHCSAEFEVLDEDKNRSLLAKTDDARLIFDEMYGKSSRAEIIDRFMNEAGLTKAGASTYYQNFKKSYDLVGRNTTKKVITEKAVQTAKAQSSGGLMNLKLSEAQYESKALPQDFQMFQDQMKSDHNVRVVFKLKESFSRGELQALNEDMDLAFREMRQKSKWLSDNWAVLSKELKGVTIEGTSGLSDLSNRGALGEYEMWSQKMTLTTRTEGKIGKTVVHPLRSTTVEDKLTLGQFSVNESWRSLVRHEFGHHLEESLMYATDKKGNDFASLWMKMSESTIKRSISEYATTNMDEAFAESFSAIMSSDYGKSVLKHLPAPIENWFVEVLGMRLKSKSMIGG